VSLAVPAGTAFEPWFEADAVADVDALHHDGTRCRVAAPGVFAIGGRPLVVLPRCFGAVTLSPTIRLQAALSMVQVLAAYQRRAKQRLVHDTEPDLALRSVGNATDLLEHLEAALLLHADLKRHGPIRVARRLRHPQRPGRIDWPRTVRRSVHVATPDGNVTVANPWRARHALDPRDTLTDLHVDSGQAAAALLRGDPPPPLRWTRRDALALLARREHELFQDRHRHVHTLLSRYHSARGGQRGPRTQDVSALYASDFALVWEAMVAVALGADTRQRFTGRYHRVDGTSDPGLTLLPDSVVTLPGGLLVVDAKHYRPDRLPATESLTKQMFYRWMLSSESGHGSVPMNRIRNVFALPAAFDGWVRPLAMHRLEGEVGDTDFGMVHVVELGFLPTATAFVRGQVASALVRDLSAKTERAVGPVGTATAALCPISPLVASP